MHPVKSLLRRTPRLVVIELLSICGFVAILTALHFLLPNSVRRILLVYPPHTNIVTSYLTAYLHLDVAHLLENIAAFLAVTVVLYALAVRIEQEQWLSLTMFFCFFGSPVVGAIFFFHSSRILSPNVAAIAVGFSGVVSSLVGVLFVAFLLTLRTVCSLRTVFLLGSAILMATLWQALWVYNGALTLVESYVALVALLFPVVGLSQQAFQARAWIAAMSPRRLVSRGLFIAAFLVYFGTLFRGLVPTLTRTGDLTVLLHSIGTVVGVVFAFITLFLLNCLPVREHIRDRGHDPSTVFTLAPLFGGVVYVVGVVSVARGLLGSIGLA